MKKIALVTSIIALATSSVFAADGTLTFTGKVSGSTCEVGTEGGKSFTVNLPEVSNTSLAKAGDHSGRTQFKINLTKCSAGKVATYFEPGSTVDAATGNLQNTVSASHATGVQVQILGSNQLAIPIKAVGSNGAQTNSQWVDVAAAQGTDLVYFAQYLATGAATAGTVGTSVQYTIIYQ